MRKSLNFFFKLSIYVFIIFFTVADARQLIQREELNGKKEKSKQKKSFLILEREEEVEEEGGIFHTQFYIKKVSRSLCLLWMMT